jgi:Cu+-exporting ATPase
VPASARPGEPTQVTITLTDARTGTPVTDLALSHQVWMHLIATRADLGTFAHLHPEPTGRPGQLAVTMVFPTAGSYIINTEFRRSGEVADVHARHVISIPGHLPAHAQPKAGPRSQTIGGLRIELHGRARAGQTSELTLSVTNAATGRPVSDLRPYLAAAAHVVIMDAHGDTFAHQHAEVTDGNGRPVFALPGQRFGPELPFHAKFSAPGLYRLWAQFETPDGHVITAPFTVHAR